MESVKDNKSDFTSREIARAKKARDLYHGLGVPSVKDFKAIIRMNAIKDNPITMEDVDIAEKIYGPSISSMKGKTTRQAPSPVVSSVVPVPTALYQKHAKISLCVDVYKINGIVF